MSAAEDYYSREDAEAAHQGEDLVFLTTKAAMEKLGFSRTTLTAKRQNDPTFPKPVVLAAGDGRRRSICWVKSELEEWMREQMKNRG
ncbi:Prophage CP4-57 regulatory protein (AlpA) [Halomonas sp. THAF12]|uniref:helix-turn-helix transcriptional regulator n=1 Tax=Halomonas sp. THAF12 TaxID=2587849 RepID=UPI0012687802|nr:AlpA family phage regulatory protein [Halomonas sp. THAF12]QFT84920.1 Prophage CP4-57 regulatory protein (AlpA) [Halomonas sp. THAF12]